MTIEIKADGYYVGFWFVGDGETRDWLGILSRDAQGFLLEYRFRYYTGDPSKDAFTDGDEKSFWTARMPPEMTEATAIGVVDGLTADLVAHGFGTSPSKTLVQGDGRAFVQAFQQALFTHLAAADALDVEPTGSGGAA